MSASTIEKDFVKTGQMFRSELAAKFWREAQDRPTDWIISPEIRGEYFVQNIKVLSNADQR